MVQATEELCEDLVPVTDKHLLGQFLAGDDAAFTKIVERHAGMVRAVCHRVLRNPSDCDDAFQATFIILASRAKSLTWHDSIGGWLHQVARRVSVRLRADLARRRIAEQDSVADQSSEDTDPLHQVGVRELGEILDCELAKLPERFRDVILLTQAEGLSRSEAATRLGISVAAVKDRLERGRELLQSRLIKRGLTLSSATLAAWLVPNSANAASIPTLVANTGQMAVAFTSGKLIGTPLSVSATLAQGFLKTFGLHKATTVLALIVTLITGGSIAYGFLQENPQRFNHGIRGQIVQLASGEKPAMTIELDEYQTLLDLDVSNNAKVWIAYEAATLDKLKVGQFVAVQLDQDHRTIKEIHAQGMIREATIRSVDESGKLVIEGDDDKRGSATRINRTVARHDRSYRRSTCDS